jgi:two-component system LytT family sensor kinase
MARIGNTGGRSNRDVHRQNRPVGLIFNIVTAWNEYLCATIQPMKKPAGKISTFVTILIHVLVWLGLFLIPFIDERQHANIDFLIRVGFTFILFASFFYFNYLFLIPRLFLRRRTAYYILSVLVTILFIIGVNMAYIMLLNHLGFEEKHHITNFNRLFWNLFFPSLFILAISMSIRISNEWFKTDKQKKEMENEKLNAELAFLKSQVNPHFLFNILNNICSLARKKSDDTENAIIKLSQIMRYMLSDSRDEKVNLGKEIEYLENYIELQNLRISDRVRINFTVEGSPENYIIEPMLLIPFVENAFKHGISYVSDAEINIALHVEEKKLLFRVENTIFRANGNTMVESGIGLKNVLRRLELLYPGRHEIRISDDGQKYSVHLQIHFAS